MNEDKKGLINWQEALCVQFEALENAKRRGNYFEMSEIADKISKLSYAIAFFESRIEK